ncbi:MAG: hypothetical protein U9P90_03175 [Patescibacteria group bacterium]|nr:hypothetical protein [Patescibacteria group bacterium]
MKTRTQEQVDGDGKKRQKLTELVPHELCVELATKYFEKMEEDMADEPIIKDCDDPEEYERLLLEGCSDAEREARKEIIKVLRIKKCVGKTYGNLPEFFKPTPEEMVEEIEKNVGVIKSQLVNNWLTLLSMVHSEVTKDSTRNWILLGLRLLPLGKTTDRFKKDAYFKKCKTWDEIFESSIVNSVAVDSKDIKLIFGAFVENAIREIKKTGRLELFDGLVIYKGYHFYHLSSE